MKYLSKEVEGLLKIISTLQLEINQLEKELEDVKKANLGRTFSPVTTDLYGTTINTST